jgi:hypothetical protein
VRERMVWYEWKRSMALPPLPASPHTVETQEWHASLVVDDSVQVGLGLDEGEPPDGCSSLGGVLEVDPEVRPAGLHTYTGGTPTGEVECLRVATSSAAPAACPQNANTASQLPPS